MPDIPPQFPPERVVRHAIISFEINKETKEFEWAKCACDYEDTLPKVQSHILKFRPKG